MMTSHGQLLALVAILVATLVSHISCQNPPNVQIRLVDRNGNVNTAAGRVEVRSNSTSSWGTVCDRGWGNKDATVVCRMMGARWGTEHRFAYFGQGSGPIYMTNVDCVGNETSLASCNYGGWLSTRGCYHYRDAGVTCGNATFETLGNAYYKTNYGVVMYREVTGWKAVCDNMWDDNEAKVLCKSMGYKDGTALGGNRLSHYYTNNPYMYLYRSRTNFNCTGTEATILDCPNTYQTTRCDAGRSASAICYDEDKSRLDLGFSLRLVNSTGDNSGVVEVKRLGLAGKICSSNWNANAASVVCRQLGFTNGMVYGYTTFRVDLPVWVTSLNCTGSESRIQDCINDTTYGLPTGLCYGAHVFCYRNSPPTVSIVGGGASYGRVQITYNGQVGSICDNYWSNNDARVVCRMNGFSDGAAIKGSYYGRGTGSIYMDRMVCYGQESSILGCRNSGWLNAASTCGNHTKDASVNCYNEVRLYKGDHSHGIAMVWANRTSSSGRRYQYWAPICGTGFTTTEATVFCRELGFQNGRTLPFGSYGRYYTTYYGNNITCTGSETSIRDCFTTNGTCYTRSSSGYAAVHCYNGTLSTNITVALAGGVEQYKDVTGRVVVTKMGVQGKICQTYWDDKDANVVCRQLGMAGGYSYQYSSTGLGPYLLSEVGCNGTESSLFDCTTGSETCSSRNYFSLDAGVLCYRNQPVRLELVGGNLRQGRVEIIYEGMRGTICSYSLSSNIANAVCKQLGYNSGRATRSFGAGSGQVFMNYPICYGFETSIFQCRNAGWRSGSSSSCNAHSYDLGVTCQGSVRVTQGISNANVSAGIVQFYRSGQWRTVCKHGFDNNDAAVVCRELGHPYGTTLPPGTFSYHYTSSYRSISYVNCTGSETSVSQCGYSINGCYGYTSYAAVICSETPFTGFKYNVTIGTTFPSMVKIYNYGLTVSICNEGFSDREARVICRSKGYTGGVMFGSRYISTSSRAPKVFQVTCVGNETDVNDCQFTTNISTSCANTYKTAYVYCYNGNDNAPVVRLARNGVSRATSSGRVEVKINGQWGTVCQTYGTTTARVVCQQLGYPDGIVRSSSSYGRGTGPVWFSYANCQGDEAALWNCRYSTFNSTYSYCTSHNNDFGVQCTGLVRVHTNMSYGAVEIWDGAGSYDLVCADNFDDVDAKVVCQEMGYTYGVRVGVSAFGRMRYSIGYTNVRCTGAETAFKDCPYDVSMTYCPSRKYASVACSNTVPGSGYRLSIENTDHGRVKIRHMNIDGYICPNNFDNNVATVICREKGYLGGFGYMYDHWYSTWRSHDEIRWLEGIKCDGSETYLSQCDGVRYGDTTNCSTYGDAAVLCYQTSGLQLRLGNKTGPAGRIEFGIDGEWGTLCTYYAGSYADRNAGVLCRMMNYTDGRHAGIGTFGPGTGPITLSSLYCLGGETHISQCRSKWKQSYSFCRTHNYDAAIMCYDTVRLVGAKDVNYGRVEVYKNKQWVPVCDHGFDHTAARVVCRKLGYPYGKAQCCNAVGNIDSSKITFLVNGCNGPETDIQNCNTQTGTCMTGKYASALCSYDPIPTQDPIVRLTTSSQNYGPVLMNRYGFWGRICDKQWGNTDASVACKSMGYAGGVTFGGQSYYDSSSYYNSLVNSAMVVGNFQCTGRESNITQCTFTDLDNNVKDLGCNYEVSYTMKGAGALCWNTGDGGIGIRLQGGTSNSGRLEVSYQGEWGRVCGGWYFTDDSAKVACRQLGFLDGSRTYVPRASGSRIWMSSLRCTGDETSLFNCPLRWDSRYCYYDAGVTCYNSIRLTRGDQLTYGLVEVNINSNWGGVCADNWNDNDVAVSCKALGYQSGYNLCCGAMGNHYAAVMSNVQCAGTETNLTKCPHDVPNNRYCEVNAAVACYNGTQDTRSLNWKLMDGNNYTGEVRVNFTNIPGRICSDGWDDKDAMVACRQLGFIKGQAYSHYRYSYGANSGPFWTSNINCAGSETSLSDCPRTTLGTVSSCSNTHSAGLLCGDNAGIEYRISGPTGNAGRVEVSVNGVWGSVCRRYWDSSEASVLCKTLGYNTGIADYRTTYPNATGPVYEADFRCTGKESTLAGCPHAGWRTSSYSYCSNHRYDAAVYCYEDVKLASGFSPDIKQGPVQVWNNGSWHYVCDTDFTDLSAKVVCQQLGFVDGKALCCSAYGSKYVKYSWYGNGAGTILPNMTMRCDGSQTDPLACLTPGTCSHDYASVVCFNATDQYGGNDYTYGFDDTSSSNGQVAVTHFNNKGRICSNFWTDTEATVLCKSLQYQTGIAYHHNVRYTYHPISSRGPFWMSAVNCTGSESSLSDCDFGDRLSLGNCSTSDIASAVCYNGDSGIQYRMVAEDNSTTKNYGRVEMAIGGVWGTVCDRYFDSREANVFCRQMNYNGGYAIGNAYYGKGSGPMWLSSLQCTGTESSLHKCSHSGFDSEVVSADSYSWCNSHRYDVSVYCVDKIKLNTGFNKSMGAVEVYAQDHWNAVCDDNFNNDAAKVVCRTLGFKSGLALKGSRFGNVDGHIGINNVQCASTAPNFDSCTYTKTESCKSGQYASVVCGMTDFVDDGFKVRVIQDDPSSKGQGYLEVKIGGIWGDVCGTDFNDRAASIACKQLNFIGGVAYSPAIFNPYFSRGQTIIKEEGPILMTQLSCTGNEDSLNKCSYKSTTNKAWCDFYATRAGVLCYKKDTIQYRLSGDANPLQGRIEMKYNGQWGTMCDPSGYSNAAKVACKSLNHKDGLPLSNVRYRIANDNRPTWFHYFRCFGNETSLPRCRNDGFNNSASVYKSWWGSYCSSLGPTAARCYDNEIKVTDIRLANGPTNGTGRVEIFLQGPDQWGTVCDDLWDDKDATVVCMMLGYAKGKAMSRATYGQGKGPIWMDNLGCKGTEGHIQDCPHNGYAIENCRHTEDAGVLCSGVLPPTTTSPSNVTGAYASTQKIVTSGETPAAAIAVPIVCAFLVAAAVCGFLYYRRRYLNKGDNLGDGLVPDIPASGRGGTGVSFTADGAMFSKSTNADVSGVSNPNYDSQPISHVDASNA